MIRVYLESPRKQQIIKTQYFMTCSKDDLYKNIKDFYQLILNRDVEIELTGTLNNSFIICVSDKDKTINDKYLLTIKNENTLVA